MGYLKEMKRREEYWELPGDEIYQAICNDQTQHLGNVMEDNIESAEQMDSKKIPWSMARKLFLANLRWGRRESNDDLITLRITSPDPDMGIDYISCRIGDVIDAYRATNIQLRCLKAISQGNSEWARHHHETQMTKLAYSGDIKHFNRYHGNPFLYFL